MNTPRFARFSGIVASLLLVAVPRAEAQVCDRLQTVPDGRIRGPFTISSATNHVGLFYQGVVGKSYSVEAMVTSAPYDAGVLTANWGAAGVLCPTADLGGIRRTEGIDPAPQPNQNNYFRASFTAPSTSFYYFRVGNTNATPVSVELSITETTLYSPAWSTIGNFNTFYSIYNTTKTACNGTLTLYNTGGTAVTTQAVSIPTGATASTNTSAMGTPRGTAGTAKFTNDCPPGAFLAEAAIADFSISPTPYFQFVHFEGTRTAATH
jgi:hypothetical protein